MRDQNHFGNQGFSGHLGSSRTLGGFRWPPLFHLVLDRTLQLRSRTCCNSRPVPSPRASCVTRVSARSTRSLTSPD
eukprot:1647885-Amphidinium_carterae.1